MNSFSMTYEEVENIVAQLTKYANAIRDQLDRVSVASARISDGTWRGQSAESYKNTFDALRPKFDLFYATIMDCVDYLNMAMGKSKREDIQVSATFAD